MIFLDFLKVKKLFFLMFINIIQYINYTQHIYNNCDHEAKLIIRKRIASTKTGKRKEQRFLKKKERK